MLMAREMMTKNPDCCLPDESLAEVIEVMQQDDCGIVPIIKDADSLQLVGVVTDRDIALYLGKHDQKPSDVRAADVMTTELVTAEPDDTLDMLMDCMAREQVRRIMIVEEGDLLVGVVSQADLALHTREEQDEIKVERTIEKISEPTAGARR